MKITRRTKLLIVALALCFTTMIGSTFAWFTDSVESENNVITAGNLDIEVKYTLDGETWADLEGATGLFQKGLWEPGHTEVVALKIENKGTLAAKYAANMNIVNETIGKTKKGADIKLSDILTVSTLVQQADDEAGMGDITLMLAYMGENMIGYEQTTAFSASNVLRNDIELQPGDGHYMVIRVDMAETVGNEANHDGTNVPSIKFGLNVVATQLMYENDSFGNDYDEDAEYPVAPVKIDSFEDLKYVRGKDGDYAVGADFTADSIIHFGPGTDVSLDLNGKTITAGKQDQFVLGAQAGSKLHLTGTGTVNAGKGFMANKGDAEIVIDGGTYNTTVTSTLNDMAFTSFAQNNSKIVINDGTFTTNVDNAALFFATSNAVIEVNGGFFENTADKTPDLFSMGTNKGNTNRIIFKGGTFVNWNPLEDRMCYTGEWPANYEQLSGPWMLVWDGYKVVSETQANGDVWYTVVKE